MMRLCSVLLCFVLFRNGLCKQRISANQMTDNSIEYFEKVKNITIPIVLHYDLDLTLKYRNKYKNRTIIITTLKTISKNLLIEVENMFHRPSLNQTVKFKLLGTRYLKRRLTNDTNVSTYLKKYCQWQGERKKLKKKKYLSVLLTGLDVYYVNRGKKVRSTGRSYIGGLCSVNHSCTVLKWKGRNVVYLLAHEVAHSLGVYHDGQHSPCPDKKYIMTPQYDPLRSPDTWSMCSRLELQKFLTFHSPCPDKRYIMTPQYDLLSSPDTWSMCSRLELQKFLTSRRAQCLRTGFEIN